MVRVCFLARKTQKIRNGLCCWRTWFQGTWNPDDRNEVIAMSGAESLGIACVFRPLMQHSEANCSAKIHKIAQDSFLILNEKFAMNLAIIVESQ